MTKKQKKVLIRIIVAAILLVILHFVPLEGLWLGLLYLIPYAVIGYDILRKAVLGIMHGEVFDENFLMAVATVGAMGLGKYSEAWQLCCSTRSANCSRRSLWARAVRISVP